MIDYSGDKHLRCSVISAASSKKIAFPTPENNGRKSARPPAVVPLRMIKINLETKEVVDPVKKAMELFEEAEILS